MIAICSLQWTPTVKFYRFIEKQTKLFKILVHKQKSLNQKTPKGFVIY